MAVIRPESMAGRGTAERERIRTQASIGSQGYDPAKLATSASFSFEPTARAKVEAAVAAFVEVLEAPDADV